MRLPHVALPALAVRLAAALPSPQDIDMSMVLDTPDPTYSELVGVAARTITYDSYSIIAGATASVSSVSIAPSDVLSHTAITTPVKRAATSETCLPQPAGASSAPVYTNCNDSAANSLANDYYASIASSTKTPTGYDSAFVNQHASSKA